MENKNILDFIEKLQSAISGKNDNKTADGSSENDNGNGEKTYAPAEKNENPSGKTNAASVFPSYSAGEDKEKSFLKSYNPFGEALQNRPQVSAPRAKKQPKEKIDLSSSKNLASDKKTEVSKNMLDLINKHNRISGELKKRGK